jgi:hypothetical protein
MNYDLYAQHVDANGSALWTAGGLAVYAGAGNQYNPMAVSDGAGGAIVAWTDIRNGNADIYTRRITGAGSAPWLASGVVMCNHPTDQLDPVLVADGTGGAIVAWRDVRNGSSDVFAQRVGSAGSALWTANGVPVCTAAFEQLHPVIACDGAGGAIIAWDDLRGASTDIYAQRMDTGGTPQWAANGFAVCAAPGSQTRPALVCNPAGSAMVAWEDQRGANADIYAQHVNPAGAAQWAANGIALCNAPGDQTAPLTVEDGAGGVALAWKDARNGNVDIYAFRIAASGGAPTGVGHPAGAPGLQVSAGYPNPFAQNIRFELESLAAPVLLEVFDAAGHRVAQRVVHGAGVTFDGRDDTGRRLAGGVYFCRFTAHGNSVTRKIVITR